MSNSHQTCVNVDEEYPLNTIPGSGDMENNGSCSRKKAFCHDQHYRKLAICSIICGISCIGIKALIHSVKAEHTTEPQTATKFAQLARKYGTISIVTWILILVSIPILLALVSYLFTLID